MSGWQEQHERRPLEHSHWADDHAPKWESYILTLCVKTFLPSRSLCEAPERKQPSLHLDKYAREVPKFRGPFFGEFVYCARTKLYRLYRVCVWSPVYAMKPMCLEEYRE